MPRLRTLATCMCALSVFAIPVSAETLYPYDLTVESLNGIMRYSAVANPGGSGTGSSLRPYNSLGWSGTWTIGMPQMGFIFVQFEIRNELDVTQPIAISVTQPIDAAFGPPLSLTGSISGSVSDTSGNGNGALVSQNPNAKPLYEAFIDGTPVRSLVNGAFNFSAPGYLTDPWDGGDFIGDPYAGGVTSDIGIDVMMQISPKDSVTFSATFLVVPEPASFALLALGGVAVLRRRRV